MPDNNTNNNNTAALIAAGAQVASSGLNYAATTSINKKTREWNEKMYATQRADALADWARTNEYNTPLAQMQRLREAGLNPHLVYGGGANSVSPPVRGTEAKSWNPQAPAFNLGQIVDQYLQTRQADASIQIMREQKDKLRAETEGQAIKNLKESKGLPFIEPMAQAKLENLLTNTDSQKATTALNLGRNVREAIRSSDDHVIAIQRAINIEKDNLLKDSQNALNKQNLANLQETNKILIEQGNLAKLQRMWKEAGLNNNSSRLEWLMAQFIMDPTNANQKLQNYIKAMGQLATSGAKQTGTTIAETASTLWNYWFGDNN